MKYYCEGSYISINDKEDMEANESFDFNGSVKRYKYFYSMMQLTLFITSIKKAIRKKIYKKGNK